MIPIIIQNIKNNEILMLGWGNKKTIKLSQKIGYTVLYSRKRKQIWIKGEKSTNYQIVKKIILDCDKDTVLFLVKQINNICCHKNKSTCFND